MTNDKKLISPMDFCEAVEKTVSEFLIQNNFGVGFKNVEYLPAGFRTSLGIKITLNFSAYMDEEIWQKRLGVTALAASQDPSQVRPSETE
jgi:hypothetical protein